MRNRGQDGSTENLSRSFVLDDSVSVASSRRYPVDLMRKSTGPSVNEGSKCNLFRMDDDRGSAGEADGQSLGSALGGPRPPSPGNDRYAAAMREALSTVSTTVRQSPSTNQNASTTTAAVDASHVISGSQSMNALQQRPRPGHVTVVAAEQRTTNGGDSKGRPLSFAQAVQIHETMAADRSRDPHVTASGGRQKQSANSVAHESIVTSQEIRI